jgi:hypothetical protein
MAGAGRTAMAWLLVLLLSDGSRDADATVIRCSDESLGQIDATERGLRISDALVPDLSEGDILLQLNSHPLSSCAALDEALAEARSTGLALLALVERGAGVRSVLLESDQAHVHAEADPPDVSPAPADSAHASAREAIPPSQIEQGGKEVATTAAPVEGGAAAASQSAPDIDIGEDPGAIERQRASGGKRNAPLPRSLSAAERAVVRRDLDTMLELGRRIQAALPLLSSHPWVDQIESFVAVHSETRKQVPATSLLDPILSYYVTVAEILTYKQEETKALGSARHRSDLLLEYGSDSRVGAWLRQYAFLSPSVVESPKEITVIAAAEEMGRWSPNEAIRLLSERALADAAALATQLDEAKR